MIERVCAWVARQRCLKAADADDFRSSVHARLIEKDYEVLAKFEGRSSLKTYLAAVINRLYLDFQVERFGKWRASAQARRLGRLAVRLECLLYRDGLTFDEACGVLQNDPGVGVTRDGLYEMSLTLPVRARRHVPPNEAAPPTARVQAELERAERQGLAERTFAVIHRSLARLPARDRLFLRLHLESGLTVAEVSRALGTEQRALYRRKEEILRGLRTDLEADGIGSQQAHELLSDMDWDAALRVEGDPGHHAGGKESEPRPSVEPGGGAVYPIDRR